MGVKRKAVEDSYGYGPAAGRSKVAGSSSTSQAIIYIDTTPSPPPAKQPPAKRQRKQKDPDANQPEKRGAIFKKACPKNILDRVDRVMGQRYVKQSVYDVYIDATLFTSFFMIDRKREGTDLHEEFSVLGSTGNVYKVVIDRTPSCSCTWPHHQDPLVLKLNFRSRCFERQPLQAYCEFDVPKCRPNLDDSLHSCSSI